MDIEFSPAEHEFRQQVCDFINSEVPQRIRDKVRRHQELTKTDMEQYHALLNARGWLAPSWPVEYCGCAWDAVQKHIFEEESARHFCPRVVPFGVSMLGPVLLKFGDEAQRSYYLPRILDGSDWWCQGYSEPGAGSDLASLQTRAEWNGNHYVVNGQKTWTTYAQHANQIFCLVRTSSEGRPQQGISFLLIDMHSPGVEVRPIRLLDGSCEVNEVFFTDVEVPPENLVGAENSGWTYAKYLLTHERTGIAGVGFAISGMDQLKSVARRQNRFGVCLMDNPLFAARVARVEIELEAMKTTNLRIVAAAGEGGAAGSAPGAESSMLKIKGTLIRQEIDDLLRRAMGPAALPYDATSYEATFDGAASHTAVPYAASYFNERKISIYGGSNEIQRGIVAKMLLGL